MPFIGDLSLKNAGSNFQRQTKKNIFDVLLSAGSFAKNILILAYVVTEKKHF